MRRNWERSAFPDDGRAPRSFSSSTSVRVVRGPRLAVGLLRPLEAPEQKERSRTKRMTRRSRLLLGAPFPVPSISCFFLYYETVGTAAGTVLQGSCHWFVNGESAGLTFSSFDSPLVGSVLSRCWCFTLRCLFSLALRYWLTLLPHSPLFHIQTASKFPTSPHNRHNLPRLEVCISTVSYLCQSQPT